MKLYYSPGACSLAPQIILRETGGDFTLERTDTKTKKAERGADFLTINPKGCVPVLELDDGYNLTEGVVIQEFLADRAPETKLAPPTGSIERLKLKELLLFLTTEIHKTFSPLFAPTTPDDYKPLTRGKIGTRFDLLEQRLSDGRAYLTGADFTIADAYFFTLANWAQFVGIASDGQLLQGKESIRAFYAELVALGRKFEFGHQRRALVSGELALTSTRLPDGSITAEVARRQNDGTWLWVIDNFSIA